MLLLLRAFIAAQWCVTPPSALVGSCAAAAKRPALASLLCTSAAANGGEAGKARVPVKIELREEDIIETFVKVWPIVRCVVAAEEWVALIVWFIGVEQGSGPGGQKINKARNCVQLTHTPTGIMAKSQEFRDLTSNRKAARKILLAKLDEHFNGDLSKKAKKIAKIRKTKARYERRRRQRDPEADGEADADCEEE